MSNVRNYTTAELLEISSKLPSFKGYPYDYWFLGMRSIEDAPDQFDDKFYLMKNRTCVKVFEGTTNSGKYGLLNYAKWNKRGCAVLKSNEWYYDFWTPGYHKGKVKALLQVGKAKVYRDNNKDLRCDETGPVYEGLYGINFHPASYNTEPSFIKKFIAKFIGMWSVACQIASVLAEYYQVIYLVWNQKRITYCLIKET